MNDKLTDLRVNGASQSQIHSIVWFSFQVLKKLSQEVSLAWINVVFG